MQGKCKTIAMIQLVLGIIGSLILAGSLGMGEGWFLAIIVFLASMLGVLTLFVILMALDELLENQESLEYQIQELAAGMGTAGKDSAGKNESGVRASNSKADLLGAASRSSGSQGHTWICPECGETNSIGSRTCKGCGRDK